MALTADQITAQNFKDFFTQILPYLNKGNGGTSDTPLGQMGLFEDVVAPYGWLVADGTVYNISDYPDLANHYERVYGAKNHWGGNGTTTFAVPDWQGEYFRACGTNSHANQGSGAAVGVHQDATALPPVGATGDGTWAILRTNSAVSGTAGISDGDSRYIRWNGTLQNAKITTALSSTSENFDRVTVRTTNTSLLCCVKAVPSSEMNTYSLTERRVGTWIDGKPLYEKTFVGTAFSGIVDGTESTFTIDTGLPLTSINLIFVKDAFLANSTGRSSLLFNDRFNAFDAEYKLRVTIGSHSSVSGNEAVIMTCDRSVLNAYIPYIIVQYTKTTDTAS